MRHRIISLLPSATEIVASLGCEDLLVGRSHECDFPESVGQLPVCCEPQIDVSGSSHEIDKNVRSSLRDALSIYRVLSEPLRRLAPTILITQTQCDVCAVSLHDVENALGELVESIPTVLALAPMALVDIWDDILRVARVIGEEQRGTDLVARLQRQLDELGATVNKPKARPTVACIEWIDPLMTAGNWTPELVKIAGGEPVLCESGKHSPWISWQDLRQADADYIIVMPCGFSIERTKQELTLLTTNPYWDQLSAVRHRRVFIADGNQYFNRPGPRVVESAQIIAEILDQSDATALHQGGGWQPLSSG
ncbi:MAG: cobalamin-binding protein [Planctomycetes bacterium]|nr:cobalamin-binding protein [Planctomycetota bacterium]